MIALLLLLQAGISGTVIDAGTPYVQPLFHARVELVTASGSSSSMRTDENGHFEFANLRSGKYRLSVTCDGYLRKTTTITVATDQPPQDVRIALDIAPTLFGHVRDPNNIPISNVLVEAIKVVYGPRGYRSVASVESALTDDRGEYHLYWLDPGDYYIRASTLPQEQQGVAIPAYAPTYHPGFRDPQDATMIHLKSESNLSAFDFRLQLASVVDLWGHISIEATGAGVGATITAVPAGAVASIQKYEVQSTSPPLRDAGDFKLNGMSPGTFIVSAHYSAGAQRLEAHRKFTLKGSERAFILQLSPGISFSGRIISESGGSPDLHDARVMLDSVDPDLPSPPMASVNANGQFSTDHVDPGDYAIRILDLPGDMYLKSAHSGDLDVLAAALRIDFAIPEPIRVVLGTDGSRLTGVVFDELNRPFAAAQVVLIPEGERRSSPNQYRVASSADDGRFALRGIPPGDYKLFAWKIIEPNAYMNANYMEGYESFGLPLSVPPGSSGNTSVRLIPSD